MSQESDATSRGDEAPSETESPEERRRWLDAELLSDLSVNAVPIVIIAAFVVGFGVVSTGTEADDPLLAFHAALVGGIVLVSAVAAWVIRGEDAPLQGSAADLGDGDDDGDAVDD